MSDLISFTTPIGRIVSGDAYKANDKDSNGAQLLYKTGVKMGQPRVEFYIGLAIEKTTFYQINPQTGEEVTPLELQQGVQGVPTQFNFWQETPWGRKCMNVAHNSSPMLFDQQTGMLMPGRNFAFKVDDGDSNIPNSKGNAPCSREGWAGHWILHFNNGFAPKTYNADGTQPLTEPLIKRGHFVQVNGTINGNTDSRNPGIFLNHNMLAHSGYGEEIIAGPDAGSVGFGGAAGGAPAGMSATPLAQMNTNPTQQPMQQGMAPQQQQGQVNAGQTITPQQAQQMQQGQQPNMGQQQQPNMGQQQPNMGQQQQPNMGQQQQQGVQPAYDMVQPMQGQQQGMQQEESYMVNGGVFTRTQLLEIPGNTEATLANLQRV